MKEILERARRVRAVGLDGDGVFFGSRVFVDSQGKEVLKERSFLDGAGVLLLLAAGIWVAFITRERSGFLEGITNKLNNIVAKSGGKLLSVRVFTGVTHEGKALILKGWMRNLGLELSECSYMGDDIFDYHALKLVKEAGGLAAAPAQAEDKIKAIVNYVTPRKGGDGAVRDLVNLILEAKGIDPTTLEIPV